MMKNFRLSLLAKILLLATFLELILFIVVGFGFFSVNVMNERDLFRNVETVMLQGYQYRSDFSKTRDIEYVEQFESTMNEFNSILDPFYNDKTVSELTLIQKDYNNTFKTYVGIMKTRGLNENLGVEGNFRESVHNIEDILKETDHDKLYVYMLQARRREKDYIMRRHPEYIENVETLVDSLVNKAARLDMNLERKTEIIKLSQVYMLSFKELVRVFSELDSLEIQLIEFEEKMRRIIKQIVKNKAAEADMIQKVQFSVVGISLILGVFLSIVIAKGIANPVIKLQKAALKMSEGNYDAKVVVNSKDEVGDLAAYFNIMAENIKTSNDTVMQQQEKLKDQNIELELLAEDLKDSFNNLSVLSNIGQSITAILNFDELFDKLYHELTTVIDSSTFAIGLLDDKKSTIEYGLIIQNQEKKDKASIPLDDESRIDVMSVLHKHEIIIRDMEQGMRQLKDNYSWFDEEFEPKSLSAGSQSALCIPIKVDNNVIGIMTVESRTKNTFKNHDIDMIRNLASYIAIAVMNAKSYQEIIKSHEELKKTQNQLVQAEKMASLGQLTTGIAHEIKNPLNFINNYSDGTVELLDELKNDFEPIRDKIEEKDFDYLFQTISEISEHLQTINKNGKRVDRIVKSMMEHARGGSGEMVPTNINQFLHEYVKLAYNGFRGQYKQFTATLKYEFDDNISEVFLRQQDFSRVITNVVDNGCYSVKKKNELNLNGFEPEILVKTIDLHEVIEIRIRDNGLGVPKNVLDKLFNPFFTTKPTGEGTGLGLSLSYDIITNGHAGSMKVETEENEFAEFIIRLPKAQNGSVKNDNKEMLTNAG
ncbi:MAG: ATP-binding protein [Candidatus Kapaibacterium sp.]